MNKEPTELRSRTMRAVKSRNTSPEIALRRLLHGAGYRFRLHRKDLPGSPDVVLPGRKSVIFMHGCFWHGHDCARGARQPKTNAGYWRAKISRNVERDAANITALHDAGWRVAVVWECELKDQITLVAKLNRFLRG
ncbi:MAG: very short patch repair endonuclease [Novosphingobium sp.]